MPFVIKLKHHQDNINLLQFYNYNYMLLTDAPSFSPKRLRSCGTFLLLALNNLNVSIFKNGS